LREYGGGGGGGVFFFPFFAVKACIGVLVFFSPSLSFSFLFKSQRKISIGVWFE